MPNNLITKTLGASGQSLVRRGLMLAGILALGTCAALAQTSEATTAPGQGPGGPGGRRGPNTEHEVQMLTQVLSLTADQQTQVRAALTEQRQKMEALRSAPRAAATTDSTEAAPTNRRAQMEALRAETDTKITAVLNDEQKTKYAALQAERKARMQEHGRPGGDGPPPPPQN